MMNFNQHDLHGIVVYEINDDGCLNGLWTNNMADGKMFNEIAKLKNKGENTAGDDYISSWIDEGGEVVSCTLTINKGINKIHSLTWADENGKILFEGSGFRFGNQLITTYWTKQ